MEEELGRLYREVRTREPERWRTAARQLGERAAQRPAAFALLRDLLVSPTAELRLRGVVALTGMGLYSPAQVRSFLGDRLSEATYWQDPVLLDAVLEVALGLPGAHREPLLAACLDSREAVVRASTCQALARQPSPRWELLQEMAEDSSLEVRAALAASLQSVRHHARAAELLKRLVSSGEPELKLLLGVHQESPPAVPAYIPPGTEPSRGTLERLEAELDRHPKQAFELLREVLPLRSAPAILQHLSSLARNQGVAALCRALHALIDTAPASERLLRALGILEQVAEAPLVAELRGLTKLCVGGLEADNLADVLAWTERRQLDAVVRKLWQPQQGQANPVDRALQELTALDKILKEPSLFTLSEALETLQRGLVDLQSDCRPPESLLLTPVYRRWIEIIDGEVLGLMGGGS